MIELLLDNPYFTTSHISRLQVVHKSNTLISATKTDLTKRYKVNSEEIFVDYLGTNIILEGFENIGSW